jgi:hypothetical protein
MTGIRASVGTVERRRGVVGQTTKVERRWRQQQADCFAAPNRRRLLGHVGQGHRLLVRRRPRPRPQSSTGHQLTPGWNVDLCTRG